MIQDIDKSEVISSHCIESPILGQIPPEKLSGGVKTLILINEEPWNIFNVSYCGDDCAKWIQKIAEEKDITIRLGYPMKFSKNLKAICVNSGKEIKSYRDFLFEAVDYL